MKTINFGAGPAKLPEEVLADVQKDLIHYGNTGISVLEMSHRTPDYENIHNAAQASLRSLLKIPSNYKILFLQGGGNGLFAAIPLNLLGQDGTADYLVTGSWSAKAAEEASKYGKINLIVPKTKQYTDIPDQSTWKIDPNASYFYYCDNETVNGIEFPFVPDSRVPLVADMSSNFLTRPLNISKFGLIFAGAQKNIGPAGVTVVIVRDDLLKSPLPYCPSILDFKKMDEFNSLYNTPPCFSIFVMGRVFEWTKKSGGVDAMEEEADKKSSLIYDIIDSSKGFYKCAINKEVRSRMNIPFKISRTELEKEFLDESKELGMIQLKGHRSVGGLRASLYNAVSINEAKVLQKFMCDFMKKHT